MILIEDEDLFVYEDILRKALPSDKKNWEDQIDKAISDWNNEKTLNNITEDMNEQIEKMVVINLAIAYCMRYLTKDEADIFSKKMNLYLERYESIKNDAFVYHKNNNENKEDDNIYNLDLVR